MWEWEETGGPLLPVRSPAVRVSSSSADHRVSSSPVRSGAAAERGILEGCPASRCPPGAGRGWPAPPLRQFWGQEQKETSMTIMLFLFVKITFWQTRLSLFILPEDLGSEQGVGREVITENLVVADKVLCGLLKLCSPCDAPWQSGRKICEIRKSTRKQERGYKSLNPLPLKLHFQEKHVPFRSSCSRFSGGWISCCYLMKTPCSPTDLT